MLVHCPGTPGHGSLLLPDTAGEKVRIIIDHFMDFREQEKKKLESDPSQTVGDVTSVNLTQLKVIMMVLLLNTASRSQAVNPCDIIVQQVFRTENGRQKYMLQQIYSPQFVMPCFLVVCDLPQKFPNF
jgi:hypothetical protein